MAFYLLNESLSTRHYLDFDNFISLPRSAALMKIDKVTQECQYLYTRTYFVLITARKVSAQI